MHENSELYKYKRQQAKLTHDLRQMENSEIIVGLDIGTTKICAIVGRKNEFGKIEIESCEKEYQKI